MYHAVAHDNWWNDVNLDQCKVKLSCSLETSNEASCHSSVRGQAVSPCFCVGGLAPSTSFCKWPCTACKDSALLSFDSLWFIWSWDKLMAFEWVYLCVYVCVLTCLVSFVITAIIFTRSCYSLCSTSRHQRGKTLGRYARNDNELGEIFFEDPFGNLEAPLCFAPCYQSICILTRLTTLYSKWFLWILSQNILFNACCLAHETS